MTPLILLTVSIFTSLLIPSISGHPASATTSTLTISVVDTISLDIFPDSDGNFATSDTSTNNVSVKTNNASGYTLSIKAGTNGFNALSTTGDSTGATIPSITTSVSENDYRNNTGGDYNNTWGYRPSKLNSANNSNYLQAPSSSTDITTIDATSSANPTTFNNYNIAIGARVNTATAPGLYTNTFVITAVANAIPYTITYNANGGSDTVTHMPSNESGNTPNEAIQISSTVPRRATHQFKGWCTVQTADNANCTGTTYNPNGDGINLEWTLDQTNNNNQLTLYAMWSQVNSFQEATYADCGKTMYDNRSDDTYKSIMYTTAEIGDLCWMTRNLDLPGGTALSAEDTDVTSDYIATYTAGNSRLEKSNDKLVLPASSTSGFDTNNYSYVYNTGNQTDNCSDPGCYSYYSWDAATLGSGRSITTDNTDAEYSICPKGWHLPNTRSGTDDTSAFRKLMIIYGGSASVSTYTNSTTPTGSAMYNNIGLGTTPAFLFTGYYYGDSIYRGDSYGYYWSSTSISNTTHAQYLVFNSNVVDSAGNSGRSNGFGVRCVKEKPTMQTVTNAELAGMLPNVGDSTTLKDARDGQEYSVAKLADNNYWMTKNLNIAGGTTLDCDTTDCDSSYTLPSDQGWQATGRLPASSTTGFSTDNYAYVYNSGNTTDCGASGQNTPCSSYYSWDVATVGSGRNISTENTDAPYSICPKGWRLPTSGQHDGAIDDTANNWKRGDFYRLATAYGADLENAYNQITTSFYNNVGFGTIANFLLAGYYGGSTFTYGGTYGLYWSSTSRSSTYSRGLHFSTGDVNSANYYNRQRGFSVRCLKRPASEYMQNQTSSAMSQKLPNVNDTTTLYDERDNQKYTVAKLADNKYWMTENLNIAGGTALSADDTDVSGEYINNFSISNNLSKSGNKLVLPASSQTGFNTANYSYVYNSGNKTSNCSDPGCYSYYSWDAATLGSGRNISTDNTNAPHSICPKGWRLPSTYNGTNSSTDLRALMIAYGGSDSVQTYNNSTTPKGSVMYSNIGPGSMPNFLLAGYYHNDSFSRGDSYGLYWSSTSYSNTSGAWYLGLNLSTVDSTSSSLRHDGRSTRCLIGN